MPNYAEFLKSQGASDEDVKLLDTPIARKAFEVQEARATDAAQAAATEKQKAKDFEARSNQWYEQTNQTFQDMQRKAMAAEAEKARAVALLKSASDAGLIELAEGMGYNTPAAPPPPAAGAFDASQYFTKDDVVRIAAQEGEAIATAQDIAYQHQRLFPDKPLNFRALRQEAVAARKPVEQVWKEKYQVDAAISARDAADRATYEAKLRAEGAEAERAKFASQYGNPDIRPLTPSHSPFTPKPESGRDKQPWDANDRSNERVSRVAGNILKSTLSN